MPTAATAEFRALRRTISDRTHVRSVLTLAGLTGWGALLVAALAAAVEPAVSLVPFTILVATFEVIRPLHAGAERIGRYLQVFVEEREAGAPAGGLGAPAWERTAMRLAPAKPGAAGHPLAAPVFALATVVNTLAVFRPASSTLELVGLALPHAGFLVWLWRADRLLRRQRADDLERYRALRDRG